MYTYRDYRINFRFSGYLLYNKIWIDVFDSRCKKKFAHKRKRWVMSFESRIPWKFLLIWLAANVLGFCVPPLVMFLVPRLTAISGLLSSTLIISLPISIAQWIALRRLFPISALWIFTLPISILVFVLLVREIPESIWQSFDSESFPVLIFTAFIIGLIIGLPQWLLLRRHIDKASIWMLGSSLGIALGAGIVISTNMVNTAGVFAYIIAVLVYVLSTGLTLTWGLTHSDRPRSTIAAAA